MKFVQPVHFSRAEMCDTVFAENQWSDRFHHQVDVLQKNRFRYHLALAAGKLFGVLFSYQASVVNSNGNFYHLR